MTVTAHHWPPRHVHRRTGHSASLRWHRRNDTNRTLKATLHDTQQRVIQWSRKYRALQTKLVRLLENNQILTQALWDRDATLYALRHRHRPDHDGLLSRCLGCGHRHPCADYRILHPEPAQKQEEAA